MKYAFLILLVVLLLKDFNICILHMYAVVGKTLDVSLYTMRALFHHCVLLTNWMNGKLTFWCENVVNGWELHCIMKFSSVRQEILLSGKCIKKPINMLSVWKRFGIQLFWLLKWEIFLGKDILTGFHCI